MLAAIRRRASTPVIMVTALAEDLDKLQALRVGADDYIVKPFNPLEVVARVKAVLRRSTRQFEKDVLRVGALTVDLSSHTADIAGPGGETTLRLTLTEFRLLACMAAAPNRVFDRSELIDACLPEGEAMDRTVDSHMSHLRRKLAAAGADGLIQSVRGVGYRMAERHV